MDKKKFMIFVLIVVFVSLCFWWYCWKYSPPKTESSLEQYKYYTGEMPPRKEIPLIELPPLNYEKIKVYTVKTLEANRSISCAKGEFIKVHFGNKTEVEFACLSGVFGEVVNVPIEELWNLPKNSTVYYSPLVIVRTPPPIEINGTEYIIGINALYYCDPAKKETRVWEMAFYYPASDKILRFVIPVNSSVIGEFRGRKVFYALDVVDIENRTLVARYSPWCISS